MVLSGGVDLVSDLQHRCPLQRMVGGCGVTNGYDTEAGALSKTVSMTMARALADLALFAAAPLVADLYRIAREQPRG